MSASIFNKRMRVSNSAAVGGLPKTWDPDAIAGSGGGSGGSGSANTKIVTFNNSSVVLPGVAASPTRIPVSGKITSVTASLNVPGTSSVNFAIEVCTGTSFNSASRVWSGVLNSDAIINASSSSTVGSVKYSNVLAGDYLRLSITNVPVDAMGLVVEVVIEVI